MKKIEKKVGYWDVMNSISNGKSIQDEDIEKHFKTFVTYRKFSNLPKACISMAQMYRYKTPIPVVAEYRFLKHSSKYPKNLSLPNDKKDEYIHIVIKWIQKEFNVGEVSAKEYLEILGGKRIYRIMEKWSQFDERLIDDPNILELRKITTRYKNEIKSIKGIE